MRTENTNQNKKKKNLKKETNKDNAKTQQSERMRVVGAEHTTNENVSLE